MLLFGSLRVSLHLRLRRSLRLVFCRRPGLSNRVSLRRLMLHRSMCGRFDLDLVSRLTLARNNFLRRNGLFRAGFAWSCLGRPCGGGPGLGHWSLFGLPRGTLRDRFSGRQHLRTLVRLLFFFLLAVLGPRPCRRNLHLLFFLKLRLGPSSARTPDHHGWRRSGRGIRLEELPDLLLRQQLAVHELEE